MAIKASSSPPRMRRNSFFYLLQTYHFNQLHLAFLRSAASMVPPSKIPSYPLPTEGFQSCQFLLIRLHPLTFFVSPLFFFFFFFLLYTSFKCWDLNCTQKWRQQGFAQLQYDVFCHLNAFSDTSSILLAFWLSLTPHKAQQTDTKVKDKFLNSSTETESLVQFYYTSQPHHTLGKNYFLSSWHWTTLLCTVLDNSHHYVPLKPIFLFNFTLITGKLPNEIGEVFLSIPKLSREHKHQKIWRTRTVLQN